MSAAGNRVCPIRERERERLRVMKHDEERNCCVCLLLCDDIFFMRGEKEKKESFLTPLIY